MLRERERESLEREKKTENVNKIIIIIKTSKFKCI